MKRLLLCLLGALALASAPAGADTPAGTSEIRVSGTGSVTMQPDVANVVAAIETNASGAGEAVAQNNATYDRIVAAVVKAGVARTDVTLVSYNMSYNPRPRIAAPNPGGGERYGYTVMRTFGVKVRDIGNAGRVADACSGSGATSINDVSFGLADPSAARTQATSKAVADARANAETLATAAHLRIVSIKSVELGGGGGVEPQPMMRMAANAPTQFDQSNVSVSVTVSATFLAQP